MLFVSIFLHLEVGAASGAALESGNLLGIRMSLTLDGAEALNDLLQMAGAASTGGAAALSLQGPVVVANARGATTEAAGSADSLLGVEGATTATVAESVGLCVVSLTEAGGTLSLESQSGTKHQTNRQHIYRQFHGRS